jgi:hypothetical protein
MSRILLLFVVAGFFADVYGQAQTQAFALSPAFDAGRQILPVIEGGGYIIFGDRAVSATNARRDLSLVRVSGTGTQLWQRAYGDMNLDESARNAIVPVGTGWLIAGTRTPATGTNTIGILVLVGNTGVPVWTKEVLLPGITTGFVINDMEPVADNGFIATGTVGTGAQARMLIIRILNDGTVEWHRIYSEGTGRGIVVTNGGGTAFIAGGRKLWSIRTSTGALNWEKIATAPAFGPTGATVNFELTDLVPMTGKQLAAVGTLTATAVPAAASVASYFLTVWTQGGDFKWQRTYNQSGFSATFPVEATSLAYHGSSTEIIMAGAVGNRLVVTRVKQNGTFVSTWQMPATGTANGQISAPSVARFGGYYAFTSGILPATGTSGVNTFFYRTAGNFLGLTGPGSSTPSLGTGKTNPVAESGFTLSPNPANDQVRLQWTLDAPQSVTFRLFGLTGRILKEWTLAGNTGYNEQQLSLDGLPHGMYFVHSSAAQITRKLLVE